MLRHHDRTYFGEYFAKAGFYKQEGDNHQCNPSNAAQAATPNFWPKAAFLPVSSGRRDT